MIEIRIKHNQGAALLIFVLIMMMASSSFLLQSLNINLLSNKAGIDHKILLQAKEALTGYAISYSTVNPTRLPGSLPCPDINGDGVSDTPCGLAGRSSLGRLPWQTLGIKPLRDSAGECLWYAVSGLYKDSPINTLSIESEGQFLLFDNNLNSLNSNNNSEIAIAVVFAPGKAIDNQLRSVTLANKTECGSSVAANGINQSVNYLEDFNKINNANGSYSDGNILGVVTNAIPSTGASTFIQSGSMATQSATVFNDTFIKISASDYQPIYRLMQRRIAERVRQCLNSYANNNGNKLPWPAILQLPGWPAYDDNNSNLRFGRIAATLFNSEATGLSPLWPIDPDPAQLGTRCFAWGWWNNVKESVFIAIDNSIAPSVNPIPTTLTVDATPTTSAIFIAGRPEPGIQNRSTRLDKATLSNYLESNNVIDLGTGSIPPGNENFISNDNAAAFFNDYVCTLISCP